MSKKNKPKILLLDIESSPIISYVWGLHDQNVAINQIKTDWHLLSWSAKWAGDPASKIMYMDQRNEKNIEDDSKLLKGIWKLLDDCDVVIGQNSKRFDIKKLNARFILNGMQKPSSFKHIDTVQLARKHFGFTSNKLEYLSNNLCKKYVKQKHKKFAGFELWRECLKGNKQAWKEMEHYNKYDVLALEELYNKLLPWDNSLNPNLYTEGITNICSCGSKKIQKNGFAYTDSGKFQRYKCADCGAESRSRVNLLSKEKRKSLNKKG